MNATLLAYIPALHQGYLHFFSEVTGQKKLLLIPSELAQEFGPVHKDLHALSVEHIKMALESWRLFETIQIADLELLAELNSQKLELVIPDEVISRELVERYAPDCSVRLSSIFLRWDRKNATTPYQPASQIITEDEFARKMVAVAAAEGRKSADWWRQVGAVAVRDGQIVAQTHNTHLPSEQQPNIVGDGRAQFHKGEHIEATTAIHAEAKLIAEAAAVGCVLAGCDFYVTDFPCPIKRLYFEKAYAVFDGEEILRAADVELIQVASST